jgi:hypothetical protein
MKVEEIAEAVANLPPDQPRPSRRGAMMSNRRLQCREYQT